MIFDVARVKNFALQKRKIFVISLFAGLIFSLVSQNSISTPSHALYFGTGYQAPYAGGGGGTANGNAVCPTDTVAVGVGFTVNGNSPGFGVYCRAIGPDGQLVATDQSSVSNTSAVGGGNTKVFCDPGKVVTGFSFIFWSNVRIRCATPPSLSDNAQTQWALAATGTEIFSNCATGIVAGFYTRTGAWTDAIGAYCLPYALNVLSYNVNGGTGTAPVSQTQIAPAQLLTVTSAYTGTRTRFTFAGWNTQANGLGTDYANGSSIRPIGATTLYAKWTSTISYDGNTNTSGTVPSPTTAVSSAAVTVLASNSGLLAKSGFTFAGWNTQANGGGTSYNGYGYASPLLRYVANDYDSSTKVWANSGSAGSAFNITNPNMGAGAGITKISTTQGVGGSNNSFTTLKGDTSSRITFPNTAMSNYTLCHVARYAGTAKQRIFTHPTVNWLSGYLSGQSGWYYGPGNSGTSGLLTGDTNWHLICDYNLNFRNNGTAVAAPGRTSLPANIGVSTWGGQASDWEIAEVLFYDVVLDIDQIRLVETSLAGTYGLTGYTPPSGNYASTGDITLYAQWNSTITYDGNGQTSAASTVPTATLAKGAGANTTLATAGTMVKTGFTFAGWNTRADGTGTNYASGLSTYQSAGSTTLYAKWTATVTYDPNTALGTPAVSSSDSTARSSDVFVNSVTSISLANLPTLGTMVKTGYTFAGWNTLANGTGTNYTSATPIPYMRFVASDFNNTTNAWIDSSGNSRNIQGTTATSTSGNIRGNPDLVDATGNGATASFKAVKGGTTDGIVLGNAAIANYTFCHVARFAGSSKNRIFAGLGGNWLSGYWSGQAGVAYHEAWITNSVGTSDTNWRVICDTGGTKSMLRSNGVDKTTVNNNTTGLPANVTINLQGSRTAPTEVSDWEVAEVVIYDGVLNQYQIESIENSLKTTYGISGYTMPATPATSGNFTPTGNMSLYAKWLANGYTLTFDSSTATSGALVSQWFTAGTAFTLPANTMVRTGYSFKNWNTAADGSGTTYTNSQSVTLFGDLTLYPQWTLLAPGVPTVAVTAGNTEITVTPTPAASSSTVGPPTSMVVTAYTSAGAALSPTKTCTVVSPATNCLITGLTNGTVYQFAATATNATATSALSTKVNGTPAGVVVTYNASTNGGTSATATATYNKPTALTLPVATKTDYVFSGWYTSSSGGTLIGAAGATYTPTSAITVYAQFVGNTYSISYNGNGNTAGTVPSNGSYQAGSGVSYTLLGTPSKVGYTFSSWNTAADGTGNNYAVGATYSSNANLTLYAKWTAASRSVTYVLNSGTSSANTSQLTGKIVGNTVVLPASNTMSRNGYVFGGWSDGTTTYAGGATWTVPASDSDFTLTAQWTPQTLSFSYDTNGGGTAPDSGTKSYGDTLVLASSTGLSKTGYTFAGWSDGTTTHTSGASITITTSKVFVAQWTAQSFSITYNGNSPTSGSVASGSYIAGGVPYAIATNGFTKTGYTFTGWSDGTNTYLPGAGYSTAANLILTAQWSPASFSITYNGNGNTGGSVPASGTFTTGTSFNASTNSGTLSKSGYTFNGWNTSADGSGTNYAESAALTTSSNLTLFAKWSLISPSINFDKGAATTTTIFPANTSAAYGSLYTLPTVDTSTVISSVTQIFTGWSDGTNTYAVGDTYRMGVSDVVFTAQWVAVYTVRYVLNGGTGSVPVDVLRADTYRETLTSSAVSKTGYSLTGWKDQSGVTIPSGSNNWVISGSSYIAYAQWSATPRTLSFDLNGGSGSQASITGKSIGELVTLPTSASTKTGYTFGGWSNAGTTYPAGATFTVANADVRFTAVWIGNTNTITYNGNGATGGSAPSAGSYVSGDVSTYTISNNSGTFAKTGFTFAGWNTSANGGGTNYAENATGFTTTTDVTLYAKWTAATYSVSYDTAGGSTAPTQSDTMYGATFTLPAAPTKSGNNFLGWETGSGATANLNAPGSTFTMGSAAITFTAKWSGISYAVAYSLNGGSGSAPTQANVSSGGSFTTAAAPTKSGFSFTGWSNGASTINASTLVSNVSDNITLTAQWTIAAPGIPGTPTATPGNGSATITISAPSTGGAPSSYTVTASPGGATCTVTAPGTSCSIAPLTNGTAYTFTTTATNSAGTSTSSSTASSAVTPAGLPQAPTGVSGSGTGGSISISWSAPGNDGGSAITDYLVEYSVAGSGTWTTYSDGVSTTTSATVTGLSAGNSYEFRVTAKNLIGNSTASFSSPTISTLPTAPTISSVTAASGQATVSVNTPTNLGSGTITEYTISAYNSSGTIAGTCKPVPGQTSCVVSGLNNGSSYTFKAFVTTTVGDSVESAASASVTPAGVPSAPSNVVAQAQGSNMVVSFTAPSDNGGAAITSYAITSSPAGATCTVGANATTYVCSGLVAGTNYSYTVKAVNSQGQSSASLASAAVTAVAAPSAPLNVVAVITAGATTLSAIVSFDPPLTENGSPVTSYTVTASPGGATCTVSAPTTYCDIPVLPDNLYTFTATATSAAGTSASSTTSLRTAATNGIAPTLVVDPAPKPTGSTVENQVLTSAATFNATPNPVVTYVWKRCTDPLDELTCTTITGASSATYALTSADIDKYIRVETTATNSIGTTTNLSEATDAVTAVPVATPTPTPTPSAPVEPPAPTAPSCDSSCQAIRDAAASKAAADVAAKIAADKAAADAAAKLKSDAAATTASTKAAADAAAAAAAAKAAVEKAAAAATAQAAADAAASAAAAKAKAAADAQAAATKAAADAAAALKNSTATTAAKAAATASANAAAAAAAAAVKAAATAAQQAATAKSTAANASKQVEIAINSLTSKTAVSQASAQANAIAAAAKAAANEAAAAAAAKAVEAKSLATAAQKTAADTAARIATEQKQAADAAAAAKAAADAAAKAAADKIAATNAAKTAAENLAKVLNEKAALAEQAAKTSDETVRADIAKKIDEVSAKVEEVQKLADVANAKVDAAVAVQANAAQIAEAATAVAQTQTAEAVAVKAESVEKTAAATKAAAAAAVAAKVAAAAKEAAAKVPSKATIIPKTSSTTSKNSATATVTGLKPGQKVKVTVNVKDK